MRFRTSAKVCLHEDRNNKRVMGLYFHNSREVIDIKDCLVEASEIRQVIKMLGLKKLKLPFYNHLNPSFQKNRAKFLVLRANGRGEVAAVLSHTGLDKEHILAWFEGINIPLYESHLTPRDENAPIGEHTSHLAGPEKLITEIAGIKHSIPPTAFFQANYLLSHDLVHAATAFNSPGDILLDLYGGFGAYSLKSAKNFKHAIVIDGNKSAILAIPQSIRLNKIQNVVGFNTYCEDYLAKISPEKRARVTHCIVNPPRGGLSKYVANSLNLNFLPNLRELTYVSCNPETLARDLRIIVNENIKIHSIQLFDMFPHTDHVETVVKLRV